MNWSELILSGPPLGTEALGPFEVSGGVVHKVDAATAMHVATQMAQAHSAFGVEMALLGAFCRGEGVWDPDALDPNLENAPGRIMVSGVVVKGGRWPDAATAQRNSDYGLCQINGDSRYLGVQGVGISLQELCGKINEAENWFYPRGYPVEVAYLSYNKGLTGAEDVWNGLLKTYSGDAVKAMADPAMGYGREVKERYALFTSMDIT